VGQDAWEEIDVIVKGGNYGWNFREGLHPGPRTPPAGFTAINPILEYGHGSATIRATRSLVGSFIAGRGISQLYGVYVFADYVSGRIWARVRTAPTWFPSRL
jgi:hypothetical protein